MKNLRLSHRTSLWFDIMLENSTHNHLIRTEQLKRAGIFVLQFPTDSVPYFFLKFTISLLI